MRSPFELDDQAIHLWAIPIESSKSVVARLYALLSGDEQLRAARFRYEDLQRSFILARGVLRVLLGRYLDVRPNNVQFLYGPKGKPAVAEPEWLSFNTSHSDGMALFAITRECEIGVDVERIRPLPDMYEIARQFFCSEETSELMSLPIHQRERAFYLCWTRKEAYIKASGNGLSMPLDSFQVTLDPTERARFIHLDQDRDVANSWTLTNIKLTDPYVAALAYREIERPLRLTCLTEATELIDR